MMDSILLLCVTFSFIATSLAFPDAGFNKTGVEPANHEWQQPGHLDSRGPCPGLNSLANHGWLPRNGRNITLEAIQFAAKHGYNYTDDTYTIFYTLATQIFNVSTTPDWTMFDLQDLSRHNTIEQDGSLSRNDIFFGDNLHFSPEIWYPVAKDLGLVEYDANDSYVTNQTAAKAYTARQEAAKAANPDFTYSFDQRNGTRGTTSLYLATLWDYEAKAAPKTWVQVFFTEERIPYLEGYTTPQEKNTDFIHEFVVAIDDIVGSD